MIAILSCTADDKYLFNLPFAVKSWEYLGVECIVFMRDEFLASYDERLALVKTVCPTASFWPYECPPEKDATYAQCSRLYAAALQHIPGHEVLITSDADMCVFNFDYWDQFEYNAWINVIGADLVPPEQVPMCYIAMPVTAWQQVMRIGLRTYQQCLDDLLKHIDADNFRGNYWAKDQETIYKHLFPFEELVKPINRAKPGTQFATRRADRDGWDYSSDILDAHLPRPGHEPSNFHKVYSLFVQMYSDKDFQWMIDYRNEYVKLMK